MREIVIGPDTEGQRLDKFLKRYLPDAGTGFLYRMLRQKKIVLNGAKADGSVILKAGDAVRIWFSDETLAKFSGSTESGKRAQGTGAGRDAAKGGSGGPDVKAFARGIIFENDDLLLYNKPAGLLTQRDDRNEASLNDLLVAYLTEKNEADLQLYRPSAVNRLDRNTSGLVICAKNLKSAQCLSKLIRDREIRKEYICLVKGHFNKEGLFESRSEKDGSRMATRFTVIEAGRRLSYVNAELLTGRTHQIRQQLLLLGHPIAGDPRYGDERLNRLLREQYGLKRQYLHSYRLTFPETIEELPGLSGRIFEERSAEDLPEIDTE